MVWLEAVDVQGHLALLADKHRLHVRLLLQGAVAAVAALVLAGIVQLCAHHPVVQAVKPGPISRISNMCVPTDRGRSVLSHHGHTGSSESSAKHKSIKYCGSALLRNYKSVK